MSGQLFITYLINLAYAFLKGMIYAAGCFLTWRAFDALDRVDIRKEISENRNVGWAIMIGAIFLGLAIVISQI